jgi:hypothetical protein
MVASDHGDRSETSGIRLGCRALTLLATRHLRAHTPGAAFMHGNRWQALAWQGRRPVRMRVLERRVAPYAGSNDSHLTGLLFTARGTPTGRESVERVCQEGGAHARETRRPQTPQPARPIPGGAGTRLI